MDGDDFVCLSDDDGLKHIHRLLKSKHTAKDMGNNLDSKIQDVKSLLSLNRVFRVGVDQTGQFDGEFFDGSSGSKTANAAH